MVKKLEDYKTLTGRKKKRAASPKLTAKQIELAQVESEIEKLLDTLTGAAPVLLSYVNATTLRLKNWTAATRPLQMR